MGQLTLRISIQESDRSVGFILEGRIAGPWVAELKGAWVELMPRLDGRTVQLDLRNVTYADADGKRVLRNIFRRTQAEVVTSSPLTQYLAEEIRTEDEHTEEGSHGKNA